MTQSIAFVRCKSEAEAKRIKAQLDNPIYHFINNVTRYGNFNNIRVLQNISILDSFDLSEKELSFIDEFNASYYANDK